MKGKLFVINTYTITSVITDCERPTGTISLFLKKEGEREGRKTLLVKNISGP